MHSWVNLGQSFLQLPIQICRQGDPQCHLEVASGALLLAHLHRRLFPFQFPYDSAFSFPVDVDASGLLAAYHSHILEKFDFTVISPGILEVLVYYQVTFYPYGCRFLSLSTPFLNKLVCQLLIPLSCLANFC